MRQQRSEPTGFAPVETVLVLIIIGIIAGVGYWVATQRTNNNATTTASSSTAPSVSNGKVTASTGTLTAIDQLTAIDGQDETKITSQYDGADQSAALTANNAASNIGGAYNEASF